MVHLKSPRFNQGNIVEPIQLVQGKVAGLSIARPGGDPNGRFITRIRGLSSRISNTEPLIVLNGVPGASLQLIDPADITSFTVLKDASSTAIYGMRAAAGVILVETDHGQSDRSA
jgi:TonB-dependent SusC/RagA subfamily outer membrane receptor